MLTVEQLKENFPKNRNIDKKLLQDLNLISVAYQYNLLKLERLFESTTDSGKKKFDKAVRMEFKLNKMDVAIRKKMGIFIVDSCGNKPCKPYQEVIVNGKISKRGCRSMTDKFYCKKFKMYLDFIPKRNFDETRAKI